MVEKAKNINNSEIFDFDIKKYLPKDNFENSKTFRKYKDLIKPNVINSNRNNFFNKKNAEFKYNDIKDNSLSEIPIRNDNLFEEELSNFNLENKEINNIINCNNEIENFQNNLEMNNQEQLKQNLLYNYDSKDINENIDNNNNLKDKNKMINSEEIKNNEELKEVIKNRSNYFEPKNPYFYMYYEKTNIENDEESVKSEENEQINEIEKLLLKTFII